MLRRPSRCRGRKNAQKRAGALVRVITHDRALCMRADVLRCGLLSDDGALYTMCVTELDRPRSCRFRHSRIMSARKGRMTRGAAAAPLVRVFAFCGTLCPAPVRRMRRPLPGAISGRAGGRTPLGTLPARTPCRAGSCNSRMTAGADPRPRALSSPRSCKP